MHYLDYSALGAPYRLG